MKVLIRLIPIFWILSFNLYAQNINDSKLKQIIYSADSSNSDAIIIKKEGQIIHQSVGSGEPIYIASAGKSLVSLGIMKLLSDGKLDSLNQPVYTIYPEWKQGNKKDITIKMLLNHTSGLQNYQNASIELEPAPDYKVENIIKLALAAELDYLPGEKAVYNNKAVALLGGVIEEVSGKRMDRYFEKEFFETMNIKDFRWIHDKAGNPTAHGAFVLKPNDFIKFGELVLNDGIYNEERLIDEKWIEKSFAQSQPFTPVWGLLWWRLPEFEKRVIDSEIIQSWRESGVEEPFIEKITSLEGRVFDTKFAFYEAMQQILGKDWNHNLNQALPDGVESSRRIYSDNIIAYYADGFRGNYLVIVPEKDIVAIRMADHEGFDYNNDFFPEFVRMVTEL